MPNRRKRARYSLARRTELPKDRLNSVLVTRANSVVEIMGARARGTAPPAGLNRRGGWTWYWTRVERCVVLELCLFTEQIVSLLSRGGDRDRVCADLLKY